MRLLEIAILAVLVIAAVIVLAMGIQTNAGSPAVASSAASGVPGPVAEPGMQAAEPDGDAAGSVAEGETAADADSEELTGVYVDLNGGEYEVSGFAVECGDGRLVVLDAEGVELVRFKETAKGSLAPASSQPSGVRVANAWAGPPVDTASKYHVYRQTPGRENQEIPLMSFYFDAGYVEIVPGVEMERKNAESYRQITRTWRWD